MPLAEGSPAPTGPSVEGTPSPLPTPAPTVVTVRRCSTFLYVPLFFSMMLNSPLAVPCFGVFVSMRRWCCHSTVAFSRFACPSQRHENALKFSAGIRSLPLPPEHFLKGNAGCLVFLSVFQQVTYPLHRWRAPPSLPLFCRTGFKHTEPGSGINTGGVCYTGVFRRCFLSCGRGCGLHMRHARLSSPRVLLARRFSASSVVRGLFYLDTPRAAVFGVKQKMSQAPPCCR